MKSKKEEMPEPTASMVSLSEYASGVDSSPVLMAGVERWVQQQGLSRKATAEDWQARIQRFAASTA